MVDSVPLGTARSQPRSLAVALTRLRPPSDAPKIASLKSAIADGNYQIDLDNVADGIVRFGGGNPG